VRFDRTALPEAAGEVSAWSVRRKVSSAFAALGLILLCVGVLSSYLLREASLSVSQWGEQHLPVIQLSTAFEREIVSARAQFIYHITVQKPGAQEAGWDHFRRARELAPQLRAQVEASGELAELTAPAEELILDLKAYEFLLGRILDAVKNNQNEGVLFATLVQDWTRVDNRLADTAAAFSRESGDLAEDVSRRSAGKLDRSARITAAGCLIAGILGSLLGWCLARDLNRSLDLAAGELAAAADQLALTSKEVVAASNLVAEGTAQQTRSLQEVSLSCGEIDSMCRRGESGAYALASTVAESKQASESGMEALGGMTTALREIAASNGKVSAVVGIVDTLAFQTNLLAMKAAVEACRSAETARALSALADEAGILAQRSGQSARETAAAVETTAAAVSAGLGHAEAVSGKLCIVAAESSRAQVLADDLSSEISGQTQGFGQMAREISRIETLTRRVTSGAGQTVAASAEVSARAATVKKIAHGLTVLAGGRVSQTRGIQTRDSRNGFAAARLAISARAAGESDTAEDESIAVCTQA